MAADLSMSYGVLLLRLALGTMFIAHSVVYMLLTLTLAGTVKVLCLDRAAALDRLCDYSC